MKKYFISQFFKVVLGSIVSVVFISSFSNITFAQVAPPAGTRNDYAVGEYPTSVAFDNITNSVWVTNYASNTISKVNIITGTRTDYAAGGYPNGIAFDNVTNSVWVANWHSSTVSKVNINTGVRIDYSVGKYPNGIAFDNVTNSVWVANYGSSTVSKVNINTGARTDYPVGVSPVGVAFDNVTNSVWVANGNSNTVSKVNITTGVRDDYPVRSSPVGVAFDNITNSVWVANSSAHIISKININTGTRIDYPGSYPNYPYRIAFDNVTNSVWVTNLYSSTVSKVNINTGIIDDYLAGYYPTAVAFDNVTNSVWVTNAGSNTVSKIAIGEYIIAQLQPFFSQIKNAPNSWKFRKTPGIKITGTQTEKPSDDIIKTVPNDWVLKVATTTDSAGKPFEIDDYRWYGVRDETDNADGWMAAKDLITGTEFLSYDASAQISLGAKASTTLYTTKEARIPVILQAVDTYYTQANTSDSLYGGGGGAGGGNNFQRFIQGSTFPKELVLAIISQESVSIKFDNEGCSSILDGGIGIMQITSLDARGSGSNLKNYPKMGDCTAVSTSKYYSNAWQGIFANIKDGFRTLQDKFGYVRKTEAVDNITAQEMKAISTVYRYNQGSPYKVQAVYEIWSGQSNDYVWNEYLKYLHWTHTDADVWMKKVRDFCDSEVTFKNCLAKTESAGMTTSAFYLRDVGNKLHSSPFGSSYQNPTYGDKLITANNSRLILFLRSPTELRVVNSAGEITGSVAGEPMEEIANSVYVPEQKFVTIFFPRAQYKYRVVGLETGEYGLSADFINNGDHTFFDADYIPTHAGEIHDYTIDWNKMSRCERGSVILEVDYEGDGIVDRVVKGSCRLTDIDPPAIAISSPSGSYLLNATTTVQFIATDASGFETIEATLNGVSVPNNQVISFTKPGENIIVVSAMDTEGNTSTATSTFNVLYTVNGFLQPIRLDGSGVYNQGMTLPVRFEARDLNGKVVSSVSAQLYIAKVNDGVAGGDEIPISTTVSSTGNQFRYDAGGHMYIFNLSTGSMSSGKWQIKAVLDSGQEIKADVQIKSK